MQTADRARVMPVPCARPRAVDAARGLFALAGLLVLTCVACSTSSAGVSCSPGTTLTCSCSGSLTGQSVCDSTGREGACQCGPGSGSSGGSSSGGGSGSSSGSAMDAGSSLDADASMTSPEAGAADAADAGDLEGGDGGVADASGGG